MGELNMYEDGGDPFVWLCLLLTIGALIAFFIAEFRGGM